VSGRGCSPSLGNCYRGAATLVAIGSAIIRPRYQSYAVGGGAREYQYSMGSEEGRGRLRLQRPGFSIHPRCPDVKLTRSWGVVCPFESQLLYAAVTVVLVFFFPTKLKKINLPRKHFSLQCGSLHSSGPPNGTPMFN
jgi:hypothetical protein